MHLKSPAFFIFLFFWLNEHTYITLHQTLALLFYSPDYFSWTQAIQIGLESFQEAVVPTLIFF